MCGRTLAYPVCTVNRSGGSWQCVATCGRKLAETGKLLKLENCCQHVLIPGSHVLFLVPATVEAAEEVGGGSTQGALQGSLNLCGGLTFPEIS